MNQKATPAEVATWMLSELDRQEFLDQEDIVYRIAERFGGEFTYDNENGNLAIKKTVLDAFRRITGEAVVWIRSERYWRRRQKGDEPGRQQP